MPYKYNPITKQLDYYEAGIGSITLNNMTDVSTGGATQDQVLAYNSSSGTWSPATVSSSGATQLSELSDVDPSGVTDNQVLIYDSGSGEWAPGDVEDSNSINTATTYYVDGDSGDDDNDGSSWANAKKTLDLLYLDGYGAIPRELKADVTVNVRGTVLSRGTDYHTRITGFYGGGKLTIQGETSDEVTGLTPTAYDNTSSSQTYHKYITVAGESWGVNDYRGMFIKFTTPAADTLYPILSNTADTIQTIALPDLDGTEVFKIVNLSSILKRAQISDPSTEVTYGTFNYDFFLIDKCLVNLEIKNIDFLTDNPTVINFSVLGDASEADVSNFTNYALYIKECKLPGWEHGNKSQAHIQSSYIKLEDYYAVSNIKNIFDSVFESTGGLGGGVFTPENEFCQLKNIRFYNQRVALWISAKIYVDNIEVDSCTELGVIIYENGELQSGSTYYGPMVITNNIIGIDIYKGGKLFVEDGLTHYFSGNDQDIRWNYRPSLYSTWDQYYTDGDKIEDNPLRSSGGTRYTPDEINNDMSFYVDGTSGNDNNDGSSWSDAKKTLDFLAKDATYPLPRIINSDVTVYCKNTIYSSGTTNFAKIDGYSGTGSITIQGETTDAVTGLTPTGYDNTDTSVTYHQYIDVATAGWTVDAYRGGFIVFTDGTSDEWFPILSNTATRLETIALPDLAGTETFKIVTLPTKFKAATTAAPGVPLTYDGYGLDAIKVDGKLYFEFKYIDFNTQFNNNVMTITGDIARSYELSLGLSGILCKINKCATGGIWSTQGPYVVNYCYSNLDGYWSILEPKHVYMCCIDSIAGTGNGINIGRSNYAVIESTRIENNRSGISIYENSSARLAYKLVFRGNDTGLSIGSGTKARMGDTFYPNYVFENNTLGIDLLGTLVFNLDDDKLSYSGNTNDIKTSDNPDTFESFADLKAGTRISNISEDTYVLYSNGGTYNSKPEFINSTSGLTSTTFQGAIDEIAQSNASADHNQVGFNSRTTSEYSFDDGTRTFTIDVLAPATEYIYYTAGTRYEKTSSDSVVIDDVSGVWFIYFDGSTLTATQTWSDDIILVHAFVALVNWSSTDGEANFIADERHGISMAPETHEHLHYSLGTLWYNGLGLTSITPDEDGSADSHAQLGYGSGEIADEDNRFEIAADTAPAQIPMFYRTGASGEWRRQTANNFPVINYSGGDNLLAYNEWTGATWQLSEISTTDFVLTHLVATNDLDQPMIGIVGQYDYGTLSEARIGATTEISNLSLDDLPTREFKFIGTVIYETKTTFGNSVKAIIVSTDEGGDYIDWRTSKVAGSTGTTNDHGSLSGLTDDDHIQYLLADGTRDADYIQFTTGAANPAHSEGLLFYDDDDKTLALHTSSSGVTLNLGQETFLRVVNKTGSQINNGDVVYIDSAQGNSPTVALADNTSYTVSNKTMGVATHNIANNTNGFITTFGLVRGLNTNSYSPGDQLWLSSTPGQFTNVQDDAPAHGVRIGFVITVDSSDGIILVSILNHEDMSTLNDVEIDTPLDGDVLTYNTSNERWENAPGLFVVDNTDVDAGGEIVDNFSASTWDACWWEYVLWNTNSGTSKRAGVLTLTWDDVGGTEVYYDSSTNDIGDTSDAVLSANYDASSGQIQIIMTTTTDNWSIKARRRTL